MDLFDRYGRVTKENITEEGARALTEPQQKALLALIEANDLALEGEARLADARKNVRELSADHDAKLEAHNKLNAPLRPEEALRQVLAAHRGEPSKVRTSSKAAKAAKVGLQSAIEALAEMRGELIAAVTAFRTLEKQRGEAIVAWLNANPVKLTRLDLVRESARVDAERRLVGNQLAAQQNREIAAIRGTDPDAPAPWPITANLVAANRAKNKLRRL